MVIAFSDVRSRDTHLCLRHRHGKSRMPRVFTITDGARSVDDNITHQFTHPLVPSRSPFNSHRNAASPKPVAVPTFGFATPNPECRVTSQSQTSQIFRRQLHTSAGAATIAVQLASKRDIAKALQATRATGRIRRNESASFKYPSIRCYRSSSRYQVTPHRVSCPCLVSFSVGHYDVLVSTPDSMFSVV